MPPVPARTVVSGGRLVQLQQEAPSAPWPGTWVGTWGGSWGPEVPNLDYQQHRYATNPETLYRSQPALRMVVDYIASRGATVPLTAYRRVSDTERERLGDDTIIGRTLGEPYPGVGQTRFLFELLLDALLWDRWMFVVALDPTGRTVWVRLPPEMWHYGPGSVGQRQVLLDPLDNAAVDPSSAVTDSGRAGGVPPILTLSDTLYGLTEGTTWRNQQYARGARVPAVIQRPLEAPDWTPEAKERFRSSWSAAWTGHGPEAGGTPVLEDGMTLAKAEVFSPTDLQYAETRLASLIEVCGFYHCAPELLGARQGTYSNMASHRQALYQETLGPVLTPIAQAITLQAARPMMDGDVAVYTEFNVEAMMRGSFEEQAQVLQSAVGGPWLLRSEARTLFNRPPVEGADQLIVPLNVTTGGLASPRDTAPTGIGGKGLKEHRGPRPVRVHTSRLERAIAGWYQDAQAQLLPQLSEPEGPEVVKGAKGVPVLDFDEAVWMADLRERIRPHTTQAAEEGAGGMLDLYGSDTTDFDPALMEPWIARQAERQAQAMTVSLHQDLNATLPEPDTLTLAEGVFAAGIARAALNAAHLTTGAYHLGQNDGAKAVGLRSKTWVVTSSHPRPSHARLNGETQPIEGTFSVGGRWPGDPSMPVEETAGCTCTMTWER